MKDRMCTEQTSGHSPEGFSFNVLPQNRGMRVDQYISLFLPELSRSLIADSIRKGCVRVNGEHKKCSYRLKPSDIITGRVNEKTRPVVVPQKVSFDILLEDEEILILSKPPGIVVHPGSGNESGTLVHGLLRHCNSIAGVGEELRPGIVHRLDKDTSGLMIVAKTSKAHRELVQSFKDRKVVKEYLALVHGCPKEREGRLIAPIGRHKVNRKKMAVRPQTGRFAASQWSVQCELESGYSLLRVLIESGRTHQIRVHMAHLGCPVAGDTLYGARHEPDEFPRQMLHAWRIGIDHPATGERLNISAPLWEDFVDALRSLGWEGTL